VDMNSIIPELPAASSPRQFLRIQTDKRGTELWMAGTAYVIRTFLPATRTCTRSATNAGRMPWWPLRDHIKGLKLKILPITARILSGRNLRAYYGLLKEDNSHGPD